MMPIIVSQNDAERNACDTDNPRPRRALSLAVTGLRPVRRISTATRLGSSVTAATTASASSTIVAPNAKYAQCQESRLTATAAMGGIVIPPKLLPATTSPVMRPTLSGNHAATTFPAGSTVAPGKPAYTNALKVYQCHSSDMSGRNANPTAISSSDPNMTGRTPNLSVHLPASGATMPEMKPNDSDRFSSVWFQPNCDCNGPANSPNEYCVMPTASPVERNDSSATT